MHEMSIMQSVLDAAFEALEKSGETRITEISLTIGEQTDIQEIPLNFAFEALKQGTPARDAKLKVHMLKTRSHCADCDAEFDHDRFSMLCPSCGSVDITLLAGRELRIDGMEADSEAFAEISEDTDVYADIIEEMRADAMPKDKE
ncbi:MAG: hydrogenase maturation nickel metallochaperone HypA [Coriobacteriia bacterium]|nr:hydrogenase maturation nickel metallochaperone HypA [Coriobacteriia bacterium]